MDIYTVHDNLKKTIVGKEQALATYLENIAGSSDDRLASVIATRVTIEFLTINIGELKRILADVEVCCEQATAASWAINPDRMGQ